MSDPDGAPTKEKSRRRLPDWLKGNTLLLPTSVWLVILLIVPSLIIIQYSTGKRGYFKTRSSSAGRT